MRKLVTNKKFTQHKSISDQEKMLRDNIERMFDETEPWRS